MNPCSQNRCLQRGVHAVIRARDVYIAARDVDVLCLNAFIGLFNRQGSPEISTTREALKPSSPAFTVTVPLLRRVQPFPSSVS